MSKFAWSPGARVGLAFGAAALAQLLSLFLAGAGHGWVAPLLASLLLWVATPVAFVMAWPGSNQRRKALLPMGAIALLANAWLVKSTIDEGNALPFYLEVNGIAGLAIVGVWIGLWLLWQAVVLGALIFGRKGDE